MESLSKIIFIRLHGKSIKHSSSKSMNANAEEKYIYKLLCSYPRENQQSQSKYEDQNAKAANKSKANIVIEINLRIRNEVRAQVIELCNSNNFIYSKYNQIDTWHQWISPIGQYRNQTDYGRRPKMKWTDSVKDTLVFSLQIATPEQGCQ